MRVTCPDCASRFPLEAGFVEADGKRMAALLADVEPVLGRAVLRYLGLWKPAKRELRLERALRIATEVLDLVKAGSVMRDGREGVRRATTPAIWTTAIEQMVDGAARLDLPIDSHGYLRAIAFGLADVVDAKAEARRESDLRSRSGVTPTGVSPVAASEAPIVSELRHSAHLLSLGKITQEEHEARVAQLRAGTESNDG